MTIKANVDEIKTTGLYALIENTKLKLASYHSRIRGLYAPADIV